MYSLLYQEAEAYHDNLWKHDKSIAYLLDRGITESTIKHFRLGYASDGRFAGRITFPISNPIGYVVGFTARTITDQVPKYLNSSASAIFDKSSVLYALNFAKYRMFETEEAIVVEGQMDTIALHQAGFTNVVGISGTALTEEQVKLLKRIVKKILLCFDSDDAGEKATTRSREIIHSLGLQYDVIKIPSGKDPDEFLRTGGDFLSLI